MYQGGKKVGSEHRLGNRKAAKIEFRALDIGISVAVRYRDIEDSK